MSQIISVSSEAELYDALANATGGEIIELAPGDYGDLSLSGKSNFDITFDSEVQIVSADPENPAVFSGLDVRDAANLTFDSIKFDYTFEPGDNIWDRPFSVSDSENITIRNSTFDGDLAHGVSDVADGYGYAIGLSFRDSTGITVEQNEFFEFYRGMTISSSSDIKVLSNDVHSVRMDGMNFAEVTGVLIENNHIHDFNASLNSLDHSDMIQFWTNGTDTPSTDITIRGNHLDIGEGDATQSIFMRNDLVDRNLAGDEMFYQNVLIENNVIVNGHRHGITVGETDNLVIQHNTVLHDDGRMQDDTDSLVEIPRISVASESRNVTVTQNITSEVNGHENQSSWTLENNAIVQDQDSDGEGYYGDVFVTTSLAIHSGTHNFLALPGGIVDMLNAGAPSTLTLSTTDHLTPRFHVTQSDDSAALYHFDASMTTVDFGETPTGTVFQWEFPDGSIQQGAQIDHTFARGGAYDVSLTVLLPNGEQATLDLTLDVSGSSVLSYDANAGQTVIDSEISTFDDPNSAITPDGIVLSNQGIALSIDREDAAEILEQDEFLISLGVTAQTAGSAGELMRLHGSFVTSITQSGELLFEAMTQDGQRIRLTTEGANIADTATHDVTISLQDGFLTIDVDGIRVATTEMSSPLADQGNHDLVFGNPWGQDNFEGIISTLGITVNASDFAEADIVTTPPEPRIELEEAPETAIPPQLVAEMQLLSETPEHTTSGGTDLGAQGVALSIDRVEVSDILGQNDFSLSMELTADSPESMGEVMRLHQSFVTSVDAEGELSFLALTQNGELLRLTTNGANLNDLNPHEIEISLSNARLEITIDGTVLAETEMTSPLADQGNHDLVFGNPWGLRDNFDGVVSALNINVNERDSSVANNFDDLFETLVPSDDVTTSQPDSEVITSPESEDAASSDGLPTGPLTSSEQFNHEAGSTPSEDWGNHLENQFIYDSPV